MQKTYTINAKVWLHPSETGAWYFVSVPPDITKEIDFYFAHVKRGWGSLPVVATSGSTTWKTSIFADKKTNSYLLPLKAEVRKKEGIKPGQEIALILELRT